MKAVTSYCYPGNQVIEFDGEGRTEIYRPLSQAIERSGNIWRASKDHASSATNQGGNISLPSDSKFRS